MLPLGICILAAGGRAYGWMSHETPWNQAFVLCMPRCQDWLIRAFVASLSGQADANR